MRTAIISNTEAAIPLMQFLVVNGVQPFLYIGDTHYKTSIDKLVAFCNYAALTFVTAQGDKPDLYEWIDDVKPDVIIVIGYPYRIHLSRFSRPAMGIYNVHFGLLPEYRGPAPLFWQLKNGDEHIGLTIHNLTEQFDEGDIVWSTSVKNEVHYNYSYVQQMFGNLIVNGIIYILQSFTTSGHVTAMPQQKLNARYYRAPQAGDVMIEWDVMDATQIMHLVKACNSWNKGAVTVFEGQAEARIIDASVSEEISDVATPGTIVGLTDNYISVQCKNGELLNIYAMNINDAFVPMRFAAKFSIQKNQRFISMKTA